ncbi:MAG: outer membrane beta-barrel protein [Pseudomonadales bacterium]
MKKLAVVFLMSLFASSAFAGPKGGDSSLGVFAFAFFNDAADIVFVGTDYGYFFSDNFKVNAQVNGSFGDAEQYTIAVGADYYLNSGGDILPYFGGTIGQTEADGFSESTYDLHVGFEQFLDERTSVDYRASYQDFIDDVGVDGSFIIQLGFKRYF